MVPSGPADPACGWGRSRPICEDLGLVTRGCAAGARCEDRSPADRPSQRLRARLCSYQRQTYGRTHRSAVRSRADPNRLLQNYVIRGRLLNRACATSSRRALAESHRGCASCRRPWNGRLGTFVRAVCACRASLDLVLAPVIEVCGAGPSDERFVLMCVTQTRIGRLGKSSLRQGQAVLDNVHTGDRCPRRGRVPAHDARHAARDGLVSRIVPWGAMRRPML